MLRITAKQGMRRLACGWLRLRLRLRLRMRMR